eukprot:2112899-Rhodomonas_salina.1
MKSQGSDCGLRRFLILVPVPLRLTGCATKGYKRRCILPLQVGNSVCPYAQIETFGTHSLALGYCEQSPYDLCTRHTLSLTRIGSSRPAGYTQAGPGPAGFMFRTSGPVEMGLGPVLQPSGSQPPPP